MARMADSERNQLGDSLKTYAKVNALEVAVNRASGSSALPGNGHSIASHVKAQRLKLHGLILEYVERVIDAHVRAHTEAMNTAKCRECGKVVMPLPPPTRCEKCCSAAATRQHFKGDA